MFEAGKFTTTKGNYGGRLPPKADEVDFPDEFGGRNVQLKVGDEVMKFRDWTGDTLDEDNDGVPHSLLKEMGIE